MLQNVKRARFPTVDRQAQHRPSCCYPFIGLRLSGPQKLPRPVLLQRPFPFLPSLHASLQLTRGASKACAYPAPLFASCVLHAYAPTVRLANILYLTCSLHANTTTGHCVYDNAYPDVVDDPTTSTKRSSTTLLYGCLTIASLCRTLSRSLCHIHHSTIVAGHSNALGLASERALIKTIDTVDVLDIVTLDD